MYQNIKNYCLKNLIIKIVSIILLSFCIGSNSYRVSGHMEPWSEEELLRPVYLTKNCAGVKIIEWQGSFSKKDILRLDNLCNKAREKFWGFLYSRNIYISDSELFVWKLSFLNDENCYRCLNDIEYRFVGRSYPSILGYTSINNKMSFITNDIKYNKFDIVFTHELFHSMSIFYGVYYLYEGNLDNKIDKDEKLAREFTEYLGLGE